MCVGSNGGMQNSDLLRDPLIRLVMDSDGVTEQDMIAVMDQLHRSLTARERLCASPEAADDGPSTIEIRAIADHQGGVVETHRHPGHRRFKALGAAGRDLTGLDRGGSKGLDGL
jgi:hypothetical protein